ncbi:MAG: hypothetical protein K8R02_06895 [Anaerohalosphaeraceae bacterium]|nr:hypothetical protein [Anaerohalosphaeraceae bacterium]
MKKNKAKKIIILFIAAVTLWFLYNWGGSLLRPLAVTQIENLTGAKVEIDTVKFKLSGKVTLTNLAVGPKEKLEPDNSIIKAKRVDAHFSLWSLLTFSPQINKLKFEDFTINAQYNEDVKQWNIAAIKPRPSDGKKKIPQLRFKRGTIKYSQASSGVSTDIIGCSGTNTGRLEIVAGDGKTSFSLATVDSCPEDMCEINGTISTGRRGELIIKSQMPKLDINLFGSQCNIMNIDSRVTFDANEINFEGVEIAIGPKIVINLDGDVKSLKNDPNFIFNIKAKDLRLAYDPAPNSFAHGSRIFEKFIPMLQVFFDNFNPQGLLDVDVVLSGDINKIAKTKCDGHFQCKDVSMQYALFPYKLDNLAGRIDVTETSMVLNDVTAKHGQVDVIMSGYSKGYRETMDCNVVMSSPNMLLDAELYKAIMPCHKKLWYIFSPTGIVSGDFIFFASPPDVRRTMLYADLLNVSTTCQYFPYTIDNVVGKVRVEGNVFALEDLVSHKNGGIITLDGKISETNKPSPKYDFKITAENFGVDSELIAAFPEKQREFFSKFDIKSAVGAANIAIYSVDNNEMPIDYLAQMKIKAEAIEHPSLPESLTNVAIDTNLTPVRLDIKSFVADYNQSDIALSGTVWTGLDNSPFGYCLTMKAIDLEITPKLLATGISEQASKTIEDFKFKGNVNINARIGKNSRTVCPDLKVAIDCLSGTAVMKKYNIPLKDITGRVTIDSSELELLNLAATPILGPQLSPAARITANGNMSIAAGSIERAKIDIDAENIEINNSLLPLMGKFSQLYEKTTPTGMFDFKFKPLTFENDPNSGKKLSVNGSAIFKNCTAGKKNLLTDVNLLLDINAAYQFGSGLQSARAFLNAMHLKVKGRPIENLESEIVFDSIKKTIATKSFKADCLGGKLAGEAVFRIGENNNLSEYYLSSSFIDISSQRFISPNEPQMDNPGVITGELNMEGDFQKPGSAIGRLIAQAKNMKSRKQSLMARISSAIFETSKKKSAFEKITLESYIKGPQLQIGRLDIIGTAIALRGTGTFNVAEDKLDIKFKGYTDSGDKDEPGFFGSLAAGLAPAFLKVDLTGSMAEPKIKVTALPVLKESLEIIGTK